MSRQQTGLSLQAGVHRGLVAPASNSSRQNQKRYQKAAALTLALLVGCVYFSQKQALRQLSLPLPAQGNDARQFANPVAHQGAEGAVVEAASADPLDASTAVGSGLGIEGQPDSQVQAVFESIYQNQLWSAEGNGSGPGSAPETTVGTRAALKQLVEERDLHSLVDIPCGAMAWMHLLLNELEESRPGFRYLGLDIARQVVEQNKQAYADKKNWAFEVLDMSSQEVPATGYDLALTRDALQHLPCRRVVASLRNLAFSGVKYLLVGSYNMDGNTNADIPAGSAFYVNLKLPPYSLTPDAVLDELNDEQHPENNKLLYLYRTSELQKQDFDAMAARC